MARFYPFTKQNSKDDITNRLAFYKSKNGKELGLSGKLAVVLAPGAPPELPDAIGSFTGLRSMDVSQNFLRALTPRIAQLQGNLVELNASHNMLTDVAEIALLTALQNLDLSFNCLRPSNLTPLSPLANLKELHLSHNLLSSDDPNSDPPDSSRTSPPPRRGSLGPFSFLYPHTPSTPIRDERQLASAPPSISVSPPSASSLDTSADSATELGTSPPRLTSSPIPLLLTPTPVHPDSSPKLPRTPSPTLDHDPLTSPTPANTPVPSPAPSPTPSPVPFSRPSALSLPLFVHLEVLVLSANGLQVFPDVQKLVSLAKLDVSENKIVEVPMGLHTQLVNLKELNLQSNLIEKLPPMMKSLKKLLVDKNPLHPAYLSLAQHGDLLPQLQGTPESDVAFPRSSSESAIPAHPQTSPPTHARSATPPPNGFFTRIFRKDHSSENISQKGKPLPAFTPVSQEDNNLRTTPEPQIEPAPQPNEAPLAPDPAAEPARAPAESGNVPASDSLKKKRAFSLPQSQSPMIQSVPSPSFDVLSIPPSPSGQSTPTEVYLEFVKKLKQTQNIKSSIDSFVTRIKNRQLDPDDLHAALRDFVHNTHTTLAAHPLWRKASVLELQEAELHLQEYVLEHLYDHIFAARQEDREKDREISQLIKRFYFITPAHLDIAIMREHEDIWRRAEQQILEINSTRSVRSKMRCVVRMCRDLIAALARAHGASLGADVLLPHLIYVILHANPPHLHSNIVYMTRFSESEASETIYYITQLVAALYFIEHIEASSLNIDPDEFQSHMSELTHGPAARADTPTPARARLTRSGGNIVFTPDFSSLVKALDQKRKEFASLGKAETAKWITENDALISHCVGLSREVLPALPTSSPVHPLAPPPRFAGVRMEDLRAIEIPQLLEDYQRLAALFRLSRPSTPPPLSLSSSLPIPPPLSLSSSIPPPTSLSSSLPTTPTPSSISFTSSTPSSSPLPSPHVSPREPLSLITFSAPHPA